MRYSLYTYRNKQEFGELDKDYNIKVCSIHDLANCVNFSNYDYVDISLVIQNLLNNNANSSFIMNLKPFLEENRDVIIRENLVKYAMNICYFLFSDYCRLEYFSKFEDSKEDKILYTYDHVMVDDLIDYFNKNDIYYNKLEHFQIQEMLNNLSINLSEECFIDISILGKDTSFLNEFIRMFSSYDNMVYIANKEVINNSFKFYFNKYLDISNKIHDFDFKLKDYGENKVTLMDYDILKISEICESFDCEFFGHSIFKKDLFENLNEFYYLNKLGLKKIFSIFLLGNSGLGKTEVAKLLSKNINMNSNLIKINFGNYSSHNALNSLIGSPRGYIGSENGELSIKLNKPHTGIILCDEFEKADGKVFNFFLELLEEGKFTDSQSVEYDLDGFIIIFTSNLNKSQFYKDIPSEFISRLDLISLFGNLSLSDKKLFVNHEINKFKEHIKSNNHKIDLCLDNLDLDNFKFDFNLNSTENIRDIKREINNQLIDEIMEINM